MRTTGMLVTGSASNVTDGVAASVEIADSAGAVLHTYPINISDGQFIFDKDETVTATWPDSIQATVVVSSGSNQVRKPVTIEQNGQTLTILQRAAPQAVIFDAARSQASFLIEEGGTPVTSLEGGKTYTISMEWPMTDGQKATSPIVPLSSSLGGSIGFLGGVDLVNQFSFVAPNVDGTTAFSWGKDDQICNVSIGITKTASSGGPVAGFSLAFPDYNSGELSTSLYSVPNLGNTSTISHNGVTLAAHRFADGYTSYTTNQAVGPASETVPETFYSPKNATNGTHRLFDTANKTLINTTPFAEGRVAPYKPATAYGFEFQSKILKEWDGYSNTSRVLGDFNELGFPTFGVGKGNTSKDGTKVVITDGPTNDATMAVAFNTITGQKVTRSKAQMLVDAQTAYGHSFAKVAFVTATPSGNYILGQPISDDSNFGNRFMLWDWGFTNPRPVGDGYLRAQHSSLGYGLNGEELLIMLHWDDIIAITLDQPTEAYRMGWGSYGHISMNWLNNHFCYSTSSGTNSEIYIGNFDASKYDTNRPKDSITPTWLGLTHGPIQPTMRKYAGMVKNEPPESHLSSALAHLSTDGSTVYAGVFDNTYPSIVAISAQ